MSLENSQIKETFSNELAGDPDARFQRVFKFYCTVSLIPSFPIERYFRSSKELIRMANIYFEEKDYLHAFILYSRFIILFLEKIKTHPNYANCDKSQLNPILKQVQTIAFPRAEKLKAYIKEIFASQAKEYKKHLELSQKLAGKNISPVSSTSLEPNPKSTRQITPEEFELLKKKYNTDNENELRLLRERELEALENRSKSESDNKDIPIDNIAPLVDRKLKPKSSNDLNNFNLRNVYVPHDLNEQFLKIAQENTNKNIETCGFLAGKLSKNVFIISTLIIPKQSGTSDTCNTTAEHELFDTIDNLNLITLGWIHTHPSQTAFLSSIDLHTQFGFQIMVPEAIAIVCAPSKNENRTFILTPDYGIKTISECNQSGFHMHPNHPPVFEECDHVQEDPAIKLNLIDLRFI